ncbi:hypothetical protein HJD17_11995 [Enterococcus faecium]|nr:hypothetical protein [Enterococcus faecium]EMF0076149.1 hypothetical protein [Enterococcus hirae]EKZ0476379.1 hypothetical protein [Enterococcus faecium]ELI7092960.1 hypothetical protein [Enterococcus faecium]MBA5266512.1 hypothetical protein [Enterococcus hirae]
MKIGPRKPSIKKSISARTTGKAKRAVKKAVIPGYGKKGTGWIKDPKKAAYNKVYNKTTFGVNPLSSIDVNKKSLNSNIKNDNQNNQQSSKQILEVVGTQYTDAERILRNVLKDRGETWDTYGYQYHDLELVLVPEPDNEYDPKAIAVYSNHPTPKNAKINRSGKIGYLPRNSGVILNEPSEIETTIKEGYGKFYIKVDVSKYLERKESMTEERESVLESENIDDTIIQNTSSIEEKNEILVNKFIFSLLAIFLGTFGIQWFYAQKFKRGLLYFVFSWTSITFFLGLYEGIKALLTPTDNNYLIRR